MASKATFGAALKRVCIPSSVRVIGPACCLVAGSDYDKHPWLRSQRAETSSGGRSDLEQQDDPTHRNKKLSDMGEDRWPVFFWGIICTLILCLVLR